MVSEFTSPCREPEFAGKFYPAGKKELRKELDRLFDKAKPAHSGQLPQAIIAPHAGYVFSGEVAASAYNQIPENARYERVFVLASSHQMRFYGASVFTAGDYKTPLGTIPVDGKLARELSEKHSIISPEADAHYYEHSLEVQLPFLQHRLGEGFMLVPLILGAESPEECREIALALEPYFRSRNLFVVSSDFSHYPAYEDAVYVDSLTADAVVSGKPRVLMDTLASNRKQSIPGLVTSLCGWTSVLTLMYLTDEKPFEYRNVHYMNSGDIPLYGDKERVVGYQAIAVYPKEKLRFSITDQEKETLLKIARRSLSDSYGIETYHDEDLDTGGVLSEKRGAFVSLYAGNELKGCIGNFQSEEPLYQVIKKMAVSASNDRRFEKPGIEMLGDLRIEISVLSPMKRIQYVNEIELGRHGIYIKKGVFGGTFLPQVATKTGWTREEFLGHCARDKAGLGWDGWKDAEIFIYEAVVFSDADLHKKS